MIEPMFGVWLHEDSADPSLGPGWCGNGYRTRYETSSFDDAEAYARDLASVNPTCRYAAQPFPRGVDDNDRRPDTQTDAERRNRTLSRDHLKSGEVAFWKQKVIDKIAECDSAGLIVPQGYEIEIIRPFATDPEALARALFATDARIEAFVAVKAERPEDRKRVTMVAWDRDEYGARTRARARAEKMTASGELAPMRVGTFEAMNREMDEAISNAILPVRLTKGG